MDKTDYLHKLLDSGSKYVFLSRPRRFGKSLFLSMVEEFFKGNRDFFEGLAISQQNYDWKRYPVLHLDFSGCPIDSDDSMARFLASFIERYEVEYGLAVNPSKPLGIRFKDVIIKAHQSSGKQVVILIDEYDKTLLDSVDNPDRQETYRQQLRSFYSNLKSQDSHIRFAMLTGVSKFGHLSIFSDLNNLEDISLSEDFGGICGITSEELHKSFEEGVGNLAQRHNISLYEAYELLRINYDGYHFSIENAPDVYNPFSIINALKNKRIANYWFQTGTPTFLVKMIKKRGITLQKLDKIEVDVDSVTSLPFDYHSSLYPVLYQSGYLTIKGYRPELNRIRLGFPNREVEMGFYTQLMKIFIPKSESDSEFAFANFYDDIIEGNAEAFMTRLQSMFSDFNH